MDKRQEPALSARDTDLMDPQEPSDPGPDIAACDRELIHIPGSIQPYGLLLVVDPAAGRVIGGAGDLEGRLTPRWLGEPLDRVLACAAAGQAMQAREGVATVLDPVTGPREVFAAVAHRTSTALLVELEPIDSPPLSAAHMLSKLDLAGASLERAADLGELCERAAVIFRRLTGFERVMVYRFLDDDAGVVVAEDRDPGLGSFLNHHFPASDIPSQARALYVRNRVRVIPDARYIPAPLRPEGRHDSLDLGAANLRSVSPIHLQYLTNMGVAASASVSIVKDGMLWGLIACHDRSPRRLSFDVRLACRSLAGSLARWIRSREDAELYRERIRLRTAEDALMERLGSDVSLEDFFAGAGDALRQMLGADGFAALQAGELYVSGRCPDREGVRAIGMWVRGLATAQPLATHCLSSRFKPAEAHIATASGLLAVTMSTEIPIVLMWFRAEQVAVVNWAGNPHKAAESDGGALTPRDSFDAWSEAVRGRSRSWTLGEIEAANRLRRSLFEARQNRRVRDLNAQLTATLADKENLLIQKDYLIKEVNHRVQNSLQLVSAFLGLQARSLDDERIVHHLDEAQRRLAAVVLVHRRLYSDDRVETVDLARYLDDLCADMRTSMGPQWGEKLSLDLAPILVSADRAVSVGLILTELVINAQKYAYAGGPGPVFVGLEQHRNRFRLIVGDRGGGKTGAREGFGTRMLNAMVEGLGGELEESDNEPGLRVVVTAPIGEGSAN